MAPGRAASARAAIPPAARGGRGSGVERRLFRWISQEPAFSGNHGSENGTRGLPFARAGRALRRWLFKTPEFPGAKTESRFRGGRTVDSPANSLSPFVPAEAGTQGHKLNKGVFP